MGRNAVEYFEKLEEYEVYATGFKRILPGFPKARFLKVDLTSRQQVQQLFSNGNSEVSLYWKDSEYGLNCKARLDWFDSDSRKIIDLKFTINLAKAASKKPIKNDFSLQARWYTRGIYQLTNITTDFFFIFIEKFAPHSIQIVQVSNEDFNKGQEQIDQGIKNINQTKTI